MSILDTCRDKAGIASGLCCLILTVFLLVFITPVSAQSTRDLTNRIKRLENEIQTLNQAIYRGKTPPPSFSQGHTNPAATEIRMQQLETELRNLTGQLEEQTFKIRQLETQLQRLNNDLNIRLQDLESGSHTSPPPPGAIMPPSETLGSERYLWNSAPKQNTSVEINTDLVNAPESSDAPSDLYNRSFALLKQQKYANSAALFQKFLDQYPNHKLAGNAIYWLGETHYVRGEYGQAAQIFAKAYQKYPDSTKAPDNVLKLGMSLAGAKKKDEACIALKQVGVEHKDAKAVVKRAKQEMDKLGC